MSKTTYRGKTSKGEQTRAHVLGTALGLFDQHGYEGTTMRAIASEAGVSLGSAYYYFPSKEHLIQGFYARTHRDHVAACAPLLAAETRLETRLLGVLEAKFDTTRGDHRFAGALFKTAADPASPLSPFSAESEPTRRDATDLFRDVLDGSNVRVKGALGEELPNLLWLYQMGVILFWVHDRSQEQARSYRLVRATAPMVCRLIRLGAHPLLRPLTRSVVKLVRELRAPVPASPDASNELPLPSPVQ